MSDAPVVVARGLAKRFAAVRALDGLDVEIPPGSTGLLGPNGAGKSTLLKVLLGLVRADVGDARILGEDVAKAGVRIRAKVGYMPEKDCHFPGMSAVDVVALCGELSGLPRAAAFRRAHEVLHYAGLSEQRYRAVDAYSAGMRQRVKFAAALVHDPDLLVLDEPTNGLDPAGRHEFLELVSKVAASGVSILLSTHLLPDVQAVCGHVVVVGQGRVLRQGSVDELTRGVDRARTVRFVGEPRPFLEALARRGVTATVDPGGGDLRLMLPEGATAGVVLEAAVESGAGLRRLVSGRASLEEVFLESVGARRADS